TCPLVLRRSATDPHWQLGDCRNCSLAGWRRWDACTAAGRRAPLDELACWRLDGAAVRAFGGCNKCAALVYVVSYRRIVCSALCLEACVWRKIHERIKATSTHPMSWSQRICVARPNHAVNTEAHPR